MRERRTWFAVGGIAVAIGLCGCAGVETSRFSYNSSYQVGQPVYGENCYDASVLLAKSAADAKQISEKVLAGIDASISEQSDTSIKAQRNRHIGVVVGSGGEELAIELQAVSASRTFVTVTTKTGFVGGAGQRAWSCDIVQQMARMAAR